MKKIFIVTVSFLFVVSLSFAQGALSVKTKAWPTDVTLGDEIRVLIQVTRLEGTVIQPPSDQADVSPFEIKSARRLPAVNEKEITQENFEIIVTVFKLGDLKIPPIAVLYRDAAGNSGVLSTPPIPVHVRSLIRDDAKDIRPIKNVVSLDARLLRNLILGGLACILTLILAAKIIWRRRRKAPLDPEALLPAHVRANLELERLQKKDFIAAGKIKEYYSELSGILKKYLERRYALSVLDLTTAETQALLREKDLESSARDAVKEILESSDLVKFANWDPPRAMADQLERRLLDLVERTKVPEPKEAGKA